MINQPIQLFKLMYLALTKEWEKDKDEKLGLYLSEADPFVTGEDSADPVIFEDFLKAFNEYGSFEDFGYEFLIKYFEKLDPFFGDLKKFFIRISKQDYINESEKYCIMTDEQLIDLFELYFKDESNQGN